MCFFNKQGGGIFSPDFLFLFYLNVLEKGPITELRAQTGAFK